MHRLASPAILLTGIALAGFGPAPVTPRFEPANPTVWSQHQPVVTHVDFVLDLSTDGYGHLQAGEQRRIADWFEMLRLDYGDHVSIDGPARNDVAEVAAQYGLLLDRTPPVTQGAIPAGATRVIISRAHASVTGCPDWGRQAVPEWGASTMSNYGCATETNLAAQVANPDDLVHGQTGAPGSDPATIGKAIKVYRDADPTGKGGLPGGVTSVSVIKAGGN